VELLRPSSLDELDGASNSLLLAGGTEVVPLLRDGILQAERLVDVRGIVPRGVNGNRIGAGTTLAELEADGGIPEALREACRLAASPQLRNMGSVGGNLLQSTRCWYWRLQYPCRLHGGDRCHAREGEHREHAIFANDFCASAHPSDVAAALLALDARLHTTLRELPLAELYRLPDEANRDVTTLEPGELILELELPSVEASIYLKAMDRRRWAFPQVGVAAARVGGGIRIGLAGVAPIPWLLSGSEELDASTPLPRTAWKVDVARALVRRALDRL
jgi:xanthine dehydrogenase YagS FAD-binding subunit